MTAPTWAGELVWTRTTGQHRVEGDPVVIDVDGDGTKEILAVNKIGQVVVWRRDGSAFGPGQDGTVTQLVALQPEDRWTSKPLITTTRDHQLRYVFVSAHKGSVVALDQDFREAWRYELKAKTQWSRGAPAVLQDHSGENVLVVGDKTGLATAIDMNGRKVWSVQLSDAPCAAEFQTIERDGASYLLAPAGDTLACLDSEGSVIWKRTLEAPILTQPLVMLDAEGNTLILCGGGERLFALNTRGEIRWKVSLGDRVDSSLVVLRRGNASSLIACTGVWGNLYAYDLQGRHQWTHFFRAKNRGRPLVLDTDRDGRSEVLVATYGQHAYLIDSQGQRKDELFLAGLTHASPVLLPGDDSEPDVLFVTTTLLAHRFKLTKPRHPYTDKSAVEARHVEARVLTAGEASDDTVVWIRNPEGAFLCVNVTEQLGSGATVIHSRFTARSTFTIPLQHSQNGDTIEMRIATASGNTVLSENRDVPPPLSEYTSELALTAWPTSAYASFDPARLVPWPTERKWSDSNRVQVGPLYLGEKGQGALIVASKLEEPARVLVELTTPILEDGTPFDGTIVFHEVVETGTVNGEVAADALPPLANDTLLMLPSGRAAKLWIAVDTAAAKAGHYEGEITLRPLLAPASSLVLPLSIEVAPLALSKEYILPACTWDYLPNRWFPDRTDEILDWMGGYGIGIFPRKTLPVARYEDDALVMEWASLDTELRRLKDRGVLLLMLKEPSVAGMKALDSEKQREVRIEYLHRLRDHLQEAGWAYSDYAFYPVDEVGHKFGKRVPGFLDAARLFKEADPKFQVYTDPVTALSTKDYEAIAPYVDVWCPNARLVNLMLVKDRRIQDILQSGKIVWSYEAVSLVKTLSPLRYNRANGWRASYFGLDGIGHWTFSSVMANHWFAGKTKDDEYALVYPGAMPVPSVRLEAMRDGLEDAAAIKMFNQATKEARRKGHEELAASADRLLDKIMTDVLELSEDAYIATLDYLPPGGRRLWHTWWDAVAFDRYRSEILEMTQALLANSPKT
jgi:outer membrane protein assembly factor BamB